MSNEHTRPEPDPPETAADIPEGVPADAPNHAERALATLWLHISRFEILQLSTEEREALGDAVDKVHQHDFPDEFEPLQRWWHDDAPLSWDPKYT